MDLISLVKSVEGISGPFALAACVAVLVAFGFSRIVNTGNSVQILQKLLGTNKFKTEKLFSLFNKAITGFIVIVLVLLVLSFGSYVAAKWIERPQRSKTSIVEDNALSDAPSDVGIRNVRWMAASSIDVAPPDSEFFRKVSELQSEFRTWEQIPDVEFKKYLEVDDFLKMGGCPADKASPVSIQAAADLYNGALGDHYGFEIHKGAESHITVIRDIEVVVTNFRTLPPIPAAGAIITDKPIVVVELENLGPSTPFPWRFSPSWILADPRREKVESFSRKRIELADIGWSEFLIKLAAKDSGLYVYNIEITVQSDSEKSKVIQLLKHNVATMFIDTDIEQWKLFEERVELATGEAEE